MKVVNTKRLEEYNYVIEKEKEKGNYFTLKEDYWGRYKENTCIELGHNGFLKFADCDFYRRYEDVDIISFDRYKKLLGKLKK